MDQASQHRSSGSYTANLIGNIKSHLAGLQGYDVMALELIQNADDAEAGEIVFDITDNGLIVRNNKLFKYCGDLDNKECASFAKDKRKCDYHKIIDVGSGDKPNWNTGRYGIGFVSTYQVTDHPEIRSSGIKLTLYPEQGMWHKETFEEPNGTSFFLPWAKDPNTQTRLALGGSPVSAKNIDQLAEAFQFVLRKSLLFLRRVEKAEVRRNGKLLLACNLDRRNGLKVNFQPTGKTERWHILNADAAKDAERLDRLFKEYPTLKSLDRSTKISIGLRIVPAPLDDGLLYAFLPTEQSTGLPLHINADFIPESDRKSVIFKGNQHEQAWNEMLVDTAATELARDLEGLREKLGSVHLWQIIGQAYEIYSKTSGHPPYFNFFWERLKVTATQAHIVETQDGDINRPNEVFLDRPELDKNEAEALLAIGGKLAIKDLRQFWTAMNKLGAPILKLEDIADLLKSVMTPQVEGGITEVDEKKLENFYQPLWSIINELLTKKPKMDPTVQRLMELPFVVSDDMYAVTINQSYAAQPPLKANRIAALLSRLAIISRRLSDFENIKQLVKPLDLGAVVDYISEECTAGRIEEVIGINRENLRELYSLFDDLDHQSSVEKTVYHELRGLPIWLSNRGMEMVKADQAFLPGGFTDPTGQVVLLDTSVLSASVLVFLQTQTKLDIKTLSIEAYVKNWLPKFFGDNGPVDETKYALLISELAKNHQALVNNDDILKLLKGFKIVPTRNGGWAVPSDTYHCTDELVKVLGDSPRLWLDDSRIPDTKPVRDFISGLGIRNKTPLTKHLVSRMLSIAEKSPPNEDARRESSEAFYALCDNYEKWKDKETFLKTINDLKRVACFPAERDAEKWHKADSLYAPYRAEAFRSQANILDFKNTQRLKTDLLKALGVHAEPETILVIKHLQYCVANVMDPHVYTYQILNERARSKDPLIAAELAGQRCIYVDSQNKFVRSDQVYWVKQQLGRFAYTIPDSHRLYKQFYDAIGIKDNPEGKDFVAILLDIVREYSEQSKPLTDSNDLAIYYYCLSGVTDAYNDGKLTKLELNPLREKQTILNLQNHLTYPDNTLLYDSEWHAMFFDGKLDYALCNPPSHELRSFVKEIGVRRLSECAQVELDFVDGLESDEPLYAENLKEKIEIIARLLHDKPSHIVKNIRNALSDLTAVSYDDVHIAASVSIGDNPPIPTPSTAVDAFYHSEEGCLILKRQVNDRRNWAHILNALFHQLIPEETGNDISKLTLMVRPLMEMNLDDAHRELSDVGIPYPDNEITRLEGLTSPDLDEMSDTTELSDHEESDLSPVSIKTPVGEDHTGGKEQNQQNGISTPRPRAEPSAQTGQRDASSGAAGRDSAESAGSATRGGGIDNKGSVQGNRHENKSRPEHKRQRNGRFISYAQGSLEAGVRDGQSERNLAVEKIGRDAVCAYEKERGREAEQMAQTHHGYDIISRNTVTGKERYIEVKSLSGEWNQAGVPLSPYQFRDAQSKKDNYWLYVVEFVSDPEHMRVHPIQNPTDKITAFMFDGNWRDLVTEDRADHAAAFVAGVRIHHKDKGSGKILEVVPNENMKILMVQFDGNPDVMRVPLNLSRIRILENSDDENNS